MTESKDHRQQPVYTEAQAQDKVNQEVVKALEEAENDLDNLILAKGKLTPTMLSDYFNTIQARYEGGSE